MSVYQQAVDAWGDEMAGPEGHLAELDVLHDHAADAANLAVGMLGDLPCVVGTSQGRVVVATEVGFYAEPGPAVFGRYGSSFRLTAGGMQVSFLGRPSCEAIVAGLAAAAPRVE